MTEKLRSLPVQFQGIVNADVILGVSIASTGEAVGHHLLFDTTTLEQLQQFGNASRAGIKTRFTHPDWLGIHDGLGKYLGRVRNFRVDGPKLLADLHVSSTAHKSPGGDLAAYVLSLASEDPASFGMSVVIDLDRVWPTIDGQELPASGGRPANATGKYPVARVHQLYAADLVDEPAINPSGLFEEGELQNMNEEEEVLNPVVTPPVIPAQPPALSPHLEAEVTRLLSAIENGTIHIGGQPPRGQQLSLGASNAELFQSYFDWLFGAPGAKLPPPELRRSDALYRAVTGDIEMHGKFDPSHAAFAAANTTSLADMAVNAMNKVVVDLYTNLTAYRWYEMIVAVQPTDGSLHDMQWLQFGGVASLPVVAEGAAYTELTPTDTKETAAFTKYGGYIGITDKMIRNSRIDEMQAIPRALTISAIRGRSAAIGSIFTQASGLGPTLAQDSKALFVADNSHGNYATTSYSVAAWKAARLECVKQSELGSSERQFLWPKFLLVPPDLYDAALIDFGYGAGPGGYPATPNNDVNPYAQDRPGDPRPIPIAVPEFTDTTDWAYIVDPRIAPVICMAYGDNPGVTTHPAPQLYSVTDPTSGLLFTNDTLPIKIRDMFAYGVATYRGIGKRVVAGA